ncbi:serine hydrolase [Flavobacterium sp.]|uniref:serine hydrolase n=1 Tax=Flavobacterium sp. TaxID=239 RepID=UPI0025CF9D9C|nr:serine hydrolase [Flavobacterium sp.]
MISFRNKNFSLLHIIIFSLLIAVLTFSVTSIWKERQYKEQSILAASSYSCNYDVKRMNGYKFIKPLMFVDEECESAPLAGIKQKMAAIIDRYKTTGDLTTASVYLREYAHNEWTSVNDGDKFDPGSLFKVPVLIAILRQDEINPGFLNKSIVYDQRVDAGKNVAFASKTIQFGQSYTVKELLSYMIKYSDNNATILLEKNLEPKILQKLFSDVGLEVPNMYASQYLFTTREYSYFMRAIYNAAYLSIEHSEYAGELLSQSNFKEGILKGLPPGTKVAHKFGESGNQNDKQLHESAIVYLANKPYLLTVMTKGKDNKKLSQFIGEISQTVYTDMLNEANAEM